MGEQPMIVTEGLTRRFGEIVAVDQLTLTVYAGEVFGFLGHNGAGKTTTVRLLNGLLAADEGVATVADLSPLADGVTLRGLSGVLTETPALEERLTARENLTIYADIYNVPVTQVAPRVAALLEDFGLAERADEKVGGYSKGMKQRLALARALVHEPQILFLDEPTAGLDPIAARHVHDLIDRLSQEEGRTIFLCTHNLVEAQALCDRVGVMEQGRLVALGTPTELAQRLQPRSRLELEIDPGQLGRAQETLARWDGLTVTKGHNGLIAVQGVARPLIPDLLRALLQAGVSVYSAAPQTPSLEDVYFALHGEGQEEVTG